MREYRTHTKEEKIHLSKTSTKHGLSKSRIYKIYHGMKQRCYNNKNPEYHHYGGRGIEICDEWLGEEGFINFYKWSMKNEYNNTLTIERNNVNDGYNPNNCSWIPMIDQYKNRTDTHLITAFGKTMMIKEWSDLYGVSMTVINHRLTVLRWTPEDSVSKSARKMEKRVGDITYNGKTQSLSKWAHEYNVSISFLSNRIHIQGLTIEEALTAPKKHK